MADKAPCAYGVSGYVVVEKTQPARGGAGPTDEALTILANLRRYAQKRQDVFTGTTNQLEWSAWQRVIDLANDAARRLAPGATGGTT